jgi:hypothetical protein
MECLVCVVVVRNVLTVHHHVLQFLGTLRHDYRSKCRHQLPENYRQKNQGAKSAEHDDILTQILAVTLGQR